MLQHMAHCRSGDKGNTSNISVIAYEPELYPFLKDQLTAERFKAFYAGVVRGPVQRFTIVHLGARNFVCQGAPGGGVCGSLCLTTTASRCPPAFWRSSWSCRRGCGRSCGECSQSEAGDW